MGSLFKGITYCLLLLSCSPLLVTCSVHWIWWCGFRTPSTKMIILENILVNWSLIEKRISVGKSMIVLTHHSFLTWMIRQVIVTGYKIDNPVCKNIIIMLSFETKFTSCSNGCSFDNWAVEWWYLICRTKLVYIFWSSMQFTESIFLLSSSLINVAFYPLQSDLLSLFLWLSSSPVNVACFFFFFFFFFPVCPWCLPKGR